MTTIFEAEMSGTLTAMSSDGKREVPEQYTQRQALREAWENAFDKMRQELRGTPVEAPKGMRVRAEPAEPKSSRKPKEAAKEAPKAVEPEEPKKMEDIFLELHPEAKEYA